MADRDLLTASFDLGYLEAIDDVSAKLQAKGTLTSADLDDLVTSLVTGPPRWEKFAGSKPVSEPIRSTEVPN